MHSLLPAILAATLLITGCGGGGGGGGSAASAPAPAPAPTPAPEPTPEPSVSFSISGTVSASASQAVDSDNNDPGHAAIANDTPSLAQAIPTPITLGGYVNQPGSGASGRSQISGDIDDFFRVELLAGQRVTLLVADFDAADADLYLYDSLGNIIDFSIEIGEVESLVIPADGTYLVNVFAFSGATNYTLAIGERNTATVQTRRHLDIVPWQSVVRYREEENPGGLTGGLQQDLVLGLGMEQRAGARGRSRLMSLRRELAAASARARRLGVVINKKEAMTDPDLHARWETLLTIKHLQRDPQVAYAEPNYRLRALAEPNDDAYRFQWHYPLIGLPQAWDTTTGDPGVVVAVVDTGVLPEHPDLAGQLLPGYDFVSDTANARDGDGIDPDPTDSGNSIDGTDSFHGSHVSGTVAARGNNNRGVAGVAYSTRIMPVRALGADGSGTSYDINQAIRYAAGLPNDSGSGPQQVAKVINLSLGGRFFSQSAQDLMEQVRGQGVVIVAAAGNDGSSLPTYPASYEGVVSVSAVDAQRRLTSYSNTGPDIDVAAPGGDNSQDINGDGYPDGVLSTGGSRSGDGVNYEYVFLSGTSMATPHVAGVVALMKSVNPELTPEDIDVLLQSGDLTDDLGEPGRDNLYGYGLINAQRAVLAALEATGTSPAENPRLVGSATTLNFASTGSVLELALSNGGKGELQLQELSLSESWLGIEPLDVDALGLGLYQVNVEREGLAAGVYAGDIVARSSVNDLTVRVLLSVGGEDSAADVGLVYILLYDAATDEVVQQFSALANEGRYNYTFNNVPAGLYQLLAGSDADNDLLICDAGEACGAWLNLDKPRELDLQEDTAEVDFPVEYLVSLPNISSAPSSTAAPNLRQKPLTRSTKSIAK